ncbi:hypothetical protein MIMGU_mgv1a002994mg [Erythranthe guttata]|uniref:Coiled-coil domain-containing protein SCD2 n=2 Tax=Erythranthe guttata TaxID=4155 RepID=A0A022RH36_ERYGU|nr:hypothetical protein MIMGU_mgv1a002994mg [Erythranthe guttata]
MASPLHRHTRSSSSGLSNMKKPQNAKAAAQRLAQVMAHQPADDEDEEDDLLYDFAPAVSSGGIGLAGGRQNKNRSPRSVRSSVDQPPPPSSRPSSVARPSSSYNLSEQQQQPLSARTTTSLLRPTPPQPKPPEPSTHLPPSSISVRSSQPVELSPHHQHSSSSIPFRSSQPVAVEVSPHFHSSSGSARSTQHADPADESQSPQHGRSSASGRSPSFSEQPTSARFGSVGRPNLKVKTAAIVPPAVPLSIKPVLSADSLQEKTRDKRLSLDFGTFKYKEPSGQQSSSALQDELDMLQEENDSLVEKLRLVEERCEEAESRTRQLEKQIASLGEGVSLEARLLSRQAAREEATSAMEQLHDVEREVKSLQIVTQRMILTQEEMEEVVLKRCWLARCWSLCVKHGIHAEIAGARYDYWSSFASTPVEVILAAGKKAKLENSSLNSDLEVREKVLQAKDQVPKMVNVESMLMVEKGLRELTSLKVEEAIAISMARKRRPSIVKSNVLDDLKLPIEGPNFSEAYELSSEETEDVLLKQAWLLYFWRRAKNQGLEADIAEERLQLWINQWNKQPTSHDAVDVERGLMELRKLGVETKLWEEPRRLVDQESSHKTLLETEYQMLA